MSAARAASSTVIPRVARTSFPLMVSVILSIALQRASGSGGGFRFFHHRDGLAGDLHRFPGDFHHGPETGRADIQAGAALDALVLVDDMHHSLVAGNAGRRAVPQADTAALALVRQDVKRYQLDAGKGRAALLVDMGLVLVAEIAQGGEDR